MIKTSETARSKRLDAFDTLFNSAIRVRRAILVSGYIQHSALFRPAVTALWLDQDFARDAALRDHIARRLGISSFSMGGSADRSRGVIRRWTFVRMADGVLAEPGLSRTKASRSNRAASPDCSGDNFRH